MNTGHYAFVDTNALKDNGYWAELFRENPITVPIYCSVCKCQRMHKRSDISPEFQDIYDGKQLKNIVVGLYFECLFCKENDNNGQ